MSEEGRGLAPESVLPAQFFGPPPSALQPERRLMLAVLEHAVWALLNPSASGSRETRDHAAEAAEWVASDAIDWPFAFLNVCHVLGLDPDALRSRLRRHAASIRAGGQAQRHFAFRRLVGTRKRVDGRYHR